MNETLKKWFAREILVHEASLQRYLARMWPQRDEVHDLCQETYARVYEAATKGRLPQYSKSFLFTTARHLMADRVRRSRIVSMETIGDLQDLYVPSEEASPEQSLSARQELMQLARAFSALPPKCREVVWLRRVDGLSQREVAVRLKISEKTVESHIAKGTRLLADALFGARLPGSAQETSGTIENETENGAARKK